MTTPTQHRNGDQLTIELPASSRRNIEENLLAVGLVTSEANIKLVAEIGTLNGISFAEAARQAAQIKLEEDSDASVPLSAEGLEQMADRWKDKTPRAMDPEPGSATAMAEYYAAESAEGRTILAALTPEEAIALQNARTDGPWDGADGIWKLELTELFEKIGQANADKGFHERGAELIECYEAALAHRDIAVKWRDDHPRNKGVDDQVEVAEQDLAKAIINLNTYLGDRLMLIVSELVEAQDELRKGLTFDYVYYPSQVEPWELATTEGQRKAWNDADTPPEGEGWERDTTRGINGWERFEFHEESYWRRPKKVGPFKPEGFISELADVFIRLADLAQELKIIERVVEMIDEKLIYNASRPFRHGKKY